MKKVLISGGAGYVGSVLLRKLLDEGYYVVSVDSLRYGGESLIGIFNHPHFEFNNCDITSYNDVDKILDKHDLYAIIHLAAIVGDPACEREPELARKINGDSSAHLLEKAIDNKIPRFVFASTCSNYGKMPEPGGYVDENSALSPVSLYAELKVKFENMLLHELPKRDNFCPTSLRFATVYGLSNRMRFDLTVNEFTKELTLGKELIVFGEQFWRPYCHVSDFSNGILIVLKSPMEKVAYDVFNVGSTEENYTKQMIVDEIQRQIPNCRIKYVKKEEDPRDYRVNFAKIKNKLGFSVTKTVPQGIKEVKDAVQLGVITNPEDQRYYNIPHE